MSSIVPSSPLPAGYRSALALNNLAISMMETGECELALKTIEESLPLMEDRTSCGTAKLQQATNRYAKQLLEQQQQQSSSSSLCRQDEDNSVIQEIDNQDFTTLREAAASTPKEGHQAFYPVRISAAIGTSVEEGDPNAVYTSQYATIFYNCAIAHLLTVSVKEADKSDHKNTQQRRQSRSQLHLKKSMAYLQAAEDMLTSVMNEDDEGNNSATKCQDDTVVLLYTLVFSLLRVVYLRLNLLTMASDAQSMVSFLCSKVDDDFEFLPLGCRDACAAAA